MGEPPESLSLFLSSLSFESFDSCSSVAGALPVACWAEVPLGHASQLAQFASQWSSVDGLCALLGVSLLIVLGADLPRDNGAAVENDETSVIVGRGVCGTSLGTAEGFTAGSTEKPRIGVGEGFTHAVGT